MERVGSCCAEPDLRIDTSCVGEATTGTYHYRSYWSGTHRDPSHHRQRTISSGSCCSPPKPQRVWTSPTEKYHYRSSESGTSRDPSPPHRQSTIYSSSYYPKPQRDWTSPFQASSRRRPYPAGAPERTAWASKRRHPLSCPHGEVRARGPVRVSGTSAVADDGGNVQGLDRVGTGQVKASNRGSVARTVFGTGKRFPGTPLLARRMRERRFGVRSGEPGGHRDNTGGE